MGKKDRFPSPANVQVDKTTGKPLAAKAPAGPLPSKPVMGKKVELVQVHYHGVNNVILHNGVHALANGINHIGKDVMDEAKKHPSIAALIKAGKITFPGEKKADESAEASDESDDGSEPESGDALASGEVQSDSEAPSA